MSEFQVLPLLPIFFLQQEPTGRRWRSERKMRWNFSSPYHNEWPSRHEVKQWDDPALSKHDYYSCLNRVLLIYPFVVCLDGFLSVTNQPDPSSHPPPPSSPWSGHCSCMNFHLFDRPSSCRIRILVVIYHRLHNDSLDSRMAQCIWVTWRWWSVMLRIIRIRKYSFVEMNLNRDNQDNHLLILTILRWWSEATK